MNVEAIREFCLAFPQATENLQWGDDLCFKVGGKIFTIVNLDNSRLCFKCTPETFAELIEQEGIRPAPYVGRYKWVMLDRLDAVRDDELQDLIRQSYEMVAAKVPQRKELEVRSEETRSQEKVFPIGALEKKIPRKIARKVQSSGCPPKRTNG
jgi:predicted DNA-binding protein (MmcQ/YjbR family)